MRLCLLLLTLVLISGAIATPSTLCSNLIPRMQEMCQATEGLFCQADTHFGYCHCSGRLSGTQVICRRESTIGSGRMLFGKVTSINHVYNFEIQQETHDFACPNDVEVSIEHDLPSFTPIVHKYDARRGWYKLTVRTTKESQVPVGATVRGGLNAGGCIWVSHSATILEHEIPASKLPPPPAPPQSAPVGSPPTAPPPPTPVPSTPVPSPPPEKHVTPEPKSNKNVGIIIGVVVGAVGGVVVIALIAALAAFFYHRGRTDPLFDSPSGHEYTQVPLDD